MSNPCDKSVLQDACTCPTELSHSPLHWEVFAKKRVFSVHVEQEGEDLEGKG
jgi:hypothetical protein